MTKKKMIYVTFVNRSSENVHIRQECRYKGEGRNRENGELFGKPTGSGYFMNASTNERPC